MNGEQLDELINRLPESKIVPAARYLEFLVNHEERPVGPEMLARIDAARAHLSPGIPQDEIVREFGV
jgi:hypothetical protein